MLETNEGTIKLIVYVGIVKAGRLLLVKYKKAPNPDKSGWWIPAPGLKFGEDPTERAKKVATDLGIQIDQIRLKDVESFVLPGGWHVIVHYLILTDSEPRLSQELEATRWASGEELVQMTDIAHGKWEIELGLRFLQNDSPAEEPPAHEGIG